MPRFCPECGKRFDSDVTECPSDGARTYSIVETGDLIGKQIDGRFTIRETLGTGGMGTVYRARQHSMDRDVAMKLLSRSRMNDEQAVRRFFRESRATSRLVNPHTITVFDFGQDPADGTFYIAMELLKGRPLTALMGADRGPMDPGRAVQLVMQALESLEEAHAAGVLHRDMKPDNIFVLDVPKDFVKVLDFGIAKLLTTRTEPITGEGLTFGTPEYMSPEQAGGKNLDARSDLYSLGQILFELLAGRSIFTEGTSLEVLVNKVKKPAPTLRQVNPDVSLPSALERLLERLLASDPGKRPESADETRRLLSEAMGTGIPDAPPPAPEYETKKPGAATVRELPRQSSELTASLDDTMQVAQHGLQLYSESLDKCTSEPAREVFSSFVETYENFVDNLNRTRATIQGDDSGWSVVERTGSRDLDLGERFEQMASAGQGDVRKDRELATALDAGLHFERAAVDHWERKLPALVEPPVRELVERVLVEGRGRVASLAEIKLRVLGLTRGGGTESLYTKLAGLLPVKRVRKGEYLFRQGEPGDTMVLVVSGRFRLEIKGQNGSNTAFGELGAGDVVGEMTCLDPAPRSASVLAITNAELYEVDRGTLVALRDSRPEIYVAVIRGVVSQLTARIRDTDESIERLFRQVRLTPTALPGLGSDTSQANRPVTRMKGRSPSRTGSLQTADVNRLASVAEHKTYPPGAIICQEGEPGRSCFVLLSGTLQIIKWVDGTELELAQLMPGSVVGQIVLADGGPRSASIRAASDVEMLELDRVTFERLVDEHVPLALRFQEQIAVSGIRQLRLADRWLTLLLTRKKDQDQSLSAQKPAKAPQPHPAPAAETGRKPSLPQSVPMPSDDKDASLRVSTYMRTALREWGMSMEDLDEVKVVIPDGQISQAEIEARKKW